MIVLHLMGELSASYFPNWRFLLKMLCIDEFKSMKSCDRVISFICRNGETHQILKARRLTLLIRPFTRYIKEARKSLKYLAMDMNANDQLIKSVFPNVQLVTNGIFLEKLRF